jgi:hypothetical protein
MLGLEMMQRSAPIAGPYIISGAVELRPRHTLRYEMRLRNLGADCQCTVRIRVVAARTMDEKRGIVPWLRVTQLPFQ